MLQLCSNCFTEEWNEQICNNKDKYNIWTDLLVLKVDKYVFLNDGEPYHTKIIGLKKRKLAIGGKKLQLCFFISSHSCRLQSNVLSGDNLTSSSKRNTLFKQNGTVTFYKKRIQDKRKRLLIQECINNFGIKNFFFFWWFLYWRILICYWWVVAHTKIKRKKRHKKYKKTVSLTAVKIHEFPNYFWEKNAKNEHNLPIFCNFLTGKKSVNLCNLYCRQESFFLAGHRHISTQAFAVLTVTLFPNLMVWW